MVEVVVMGFYLITKRKLLLLRLQLAFAGYDAVISLPLLQQMNLNDGIEMMELLGFVLMAEKMKFQMRKTMVYVVHQY